MMEFFFKRKKFVDYYKFFLLLFFHEISAENDIGDERYDNTKDNE